MTGAKSDYERELGVRLRAARARRGLSLMGVEEKSGGRFTAVTVGTYERAERSVTVARLSELAGFYGVTVASLLPGDGGGGCGEECAQAMAVVAKLAVMCDVTVDELLRRAS